MTTPESKVKKKVRELLDDHNNGMYYNMPVPAGYGEPMLDFVGCFFGKFFAIETKAPGKKLTPRQEYTKANMEAAGGKVFVISDTDEANPDTWAEWTNLRMWLQAVENDQ